MKKILCVFLFLVACSSSHEEPVSGQEGVAGGDPIDNISGGGEKDENCIPEGMDVVIFEDVSEGLFKSSCTRCHFAGSGLMNLEDYPTIVENIKSIKDSIDSGRMPLGGSLTDSQKNLLAVWMNVGLPERANDINFCDQ